MSEGAPTVGNEQTVQFEILKNWAARGHGICLPTSKYRMEKIMVDFLKGSVQLEMTAVIWPM